MSELCIRRATLEDLPAILALLRLSMGREDDPRFASLFRWKHLDNAFGPSPIWLACDNDRIVGLRAFMRWEFERGGATTRVVRAVDTATHPDYQGRGIFKRLTLQALEEIRGEGVDFVFNTPNDKSRPGYLKMGWRVAGRAPAMFRPTSIASLLVLSGARTSASHWSEPLNVGVELDVALRDSDALEQLLASRRPSARLRTRATAAMLRWRYGSPVLRYRAIMASDDLRDGIAVVRVRRRGSAREGALVDLLAPASVSAGKVARRAVRALKRDADYVLTIGNLPGFVPLPKIGPVVTTRSVASDAPASVSEFAFSLGDLELF